MHMQIMFSTKTDVYFVMYTDVSKTRVYIST